MPDFDDENNHLLILYQAHQSVVTNAVAPRSLERKLGFAETARVFR